MALKLLPSPDETAPEAPPKGARVLAAGAPPSPGAPPSDLSQYLMFGEVLVWWGDKHRVYLGPILMVVLAAVSILGFVSVLAPEFWLQPPMELVKPLAVLLSPALFVAIRERLNQRAVLVTDTCILDVAPDGRMSRLPFEKIRVVRRDWIRGGILLQAGRTRVLVPPPLADDARAAIASQMRHRPRSKHSEIDDPVGWMP